MTSLLRFRICIICPVDKLFRSDSILDGMLEGILNWEESMRNWKTLLASALIASVGFGTAVVAQDAAAPPITDLPRNETLIINNPENPAASPDNFNMWVAGNGAAWSNGLHQL